MASKGFWHLAPAIGGAFAAAVLGAAIQELTSGGAESKVLWTIAGVLALATIGLYATLRLHRESTEELYDDLRRQADGLNTAFQARTTQLSNQVDRVSKQFGQSVERVLISDIKKMTSISEDRTIELILNAKQELLILDLLSQNGFWSDETLPDKHAAEFFNALADHAQRHSPPFIYTRIVQVDDVTDPFSRANAKATTLDHCKRMLQLRKDKGISISLRVAQKRFPQKFILIDKSILILQLHEYDGGDGTLKLWQELLISDPHGGLVPAFREIWTEIEQESIAVQPGHLAFTEQAAVEP